MTTYELVDLQHSDDRDGPWKLYVYQENGYHTGGVWFYRTPKNGDMDTMEAMALADIAIEENREVRVCDGGDMLVFHFDGRDVRHGANFWDDVCQ
jgi:hypothetical protein